MTDENFEIDNFIGIYQEVYPEGCNSVGNVDPVKVVEFATYN